MKASGIILLFGMVLLILGCSPAPGGSRGFTVGRPTATSTFAAGIVVTGQETNTPLAVIHTPTSAGASHLQKPSNSPPAGQRIFDVESSGTGPDKRAPYGDSYQINRLERPFLQDMSYVPDLDIHSYGVSSDNDWYYVSIKLIGSNPNNGLGIFYGVEIDKNLDGFGDYILWGHPQYSREWSTENVKVFEDANHDTGGHSSIKSDAPSSGDGYEKLIFSGGSGDADPDLAWMRIDAGPNAQVQFAFKKSLTSTPFMLGVLADAGLKDASRMDYVDRFTAQEAGSPVRDNRYYPLQALFAVDNVCREGVGFSLVGNEPQGCPVDQSGSKKPGSEGCPAPPGCTVWDPVACVCNG